MNMVELLQMDKSNEKVVGNFFFFINSSSIFQIEDPEVDSFFTQAEVIKL